MVCPCALGLSARPQAGGYKATKKNRQLLKNLRRGSKIGFTAKASLKAKGLLPRTSKQYKGKYVLGPKYSSTGRNQVLTRRNRRG